jgi:hypothetical protein
MRVLVHQIVIPATSTIGYGEGIDVADSQHVSFSGDHRPMGEIQRALAGNDDAPVIAVVQDWQVIGERVGN